jgi:hypothetical protein
VNWLLRVLFGVNSPTDAFRKPQEPDRDTITLTREDFKRRIDITYETGRIHGETMGYLQGVREAQRMRLESDARMNMRPQGDNNG